MIDNERKHFETLTYSDMIAINQYDALLANLDLQQEMTDAAIFQDYFLLAFPIVMYGGTWAFQRLVSRRSMIKKENRFTQGGDENLKLNTFEVQKQARQFEDDFLKHIDDLEVLKVEIPSAGTKLESIQKMWHPNHLKEALGQLKGADHKNGVMAYRRIISTLYERIAKTENYPTLHSKYLELYFGKKSKEAYEALKSEYSKLTGIIL
jgi:hypothetical protein